MSPERWRRVKGIFQQVLEAPAETRGAALEAACGGDPGLRVEVEALLAADGATSSPLDEGAAELAAGLILGRAGATREGRRLGPYRLRREIGRGGMGTVYLAERADGQYRDRVAIKLIKRGMDSEAILVRFRQERQILADLKHPNIARLLDGGISEEGSPYFVMEHIEGEPIDRYCDRRRLGVRARITLFRRVCEAVQAAHGSLVVHCDLKPANILVTGSGVPKLVDFGVARLLDPEHGALGQTQDAAGRLLTPEYASPEQVSGGALTTATDIYSLGMVLYRLLTGSHPYPLAGAGPAEVVEIVCRRRPTRASLSVAGPAVSAADSAGESSGARPSGPPLPSERLRRRLRGDLDTILGKALAKEPGGRYASARELAEDLGRHLEGRPVLARAPTLGYRAAKFLRRHWLAAAAVALVLAAQSAAVLVARRAAAEAEQSLRRSERTLGFLIDVFRAADPEERPGAEITAREVLEKGSAEILESLREEPELRAAIQDAIGFIHLHLGSYELAEPLLQEAWETHRRLGGPRERLLSQRHLGLLRYRRGRWAEAEPLQRQALTQALALWEAGKWPADLPGPADDLNALGLSLKKKGEVEEAEVLFRRALARSREAPAGPGFLLSTTLNNLGVLLRDRDGAAGLAEAEVLLREALALRRAESGEGSVRVARAMGNLGVTLRHLRRLDEAEELLRGALEIQRRARADQHPEIALLLNNLAQVRTHRGDLAEADALTLEAVEMLRSTAGPGHPDLGKLVGNLASLRRAQGLSAEAEALYREALALRRASLPAGHEALAASLRSLAIALRRTGGGREAEDLLQEAVEIRRLHPESPAALGAELLALGRLYFEILDDPSRAEAALAEALDFLRSSGTPGQVATAELFLGASLLRQRRLEPAESLLLAGRAGLEEALGAEHGRTQLAADFLVELQARKAERP